jgi:hypothetical protein
VQTRRGISGFDDSIEHAWLDEQATAMVAFVHFEIGVAPAHE